MDSLIKILVVEDDMIIAAKISMQLTTLGYEVTGIVPRGEEAIIQAEENKPDIILLDINLKGVLDGIETAHEMNRIVNVPIIYVTANADEATFNRAKETRPYAFISKPIKNIDLQRAIELTISRMETGANQQLADPKGEGENTYLLDDRIFVRFKDRMVKIMFDAILHVEADRNYCRVFTQHKEYLLTMPMKALEEKLPPAQFQRIHRSHIVNLAHVDEVAEGHVMIGAKHLPLSQSLREEFLNRFKTV